MKKNGFTLIELIAVLVILSILAMMAAPNVVSIMSQGNEESFVSEVETYLSKANYMYNTVSIRNDQNGPFVCTESATNVTCKISLDKIDIKVNEKDPFGYEYMSEISYVGYEEPNVSASTVGTRITSIFIKSCKDPETQAKCHCIKSDNVTTLTSDDIKTGSECNS